MLWANGISTLLTWVKVDDNTPLPGSEIPPRSGRVFLDSHKPIFRMGRGNQLSATQELDAPVLLESMGYVGKVPGQIQTFIA
jgi:hypothetical protein